MAQLILMWDNTAVNASANATGQRGSKRIVVVGGAWSTLGFTPINDWPKSQDNALVDVIANRVYEFMIEALCTDGGPIPNNNGPKQGLVFECIAPFFDSGSTTIDVGVSLLNTDITKVKFVLKRNSDDVIVGTITANNVGDQAIANFAGLDPSTNYYVEIELYAVVDGVEVISSGVQPGGTGQVCGGDVIGYQVATTAAPACPAPAALVVG